MMISDFFDLGSIIMIRLRPYQIDSIDRIYNAWLNCKSVLFQMPSGTGKTIVFSEIVKREVNNGYNVLIIAHRQEIIYQIQSRLSNIGLETGVIMAGHIEDRSKLIQVASIQTLNRRDHPPARLIVIDEAHHSTASSYRKLWEIYNKEEKFLGVTATPIRLSGESFEDFDVLVESLSIKWFIQQGYLSQYKYYASSIPDVSNIKIRSGDYAEEELSVLMRQKNLMADLIESYKKHAYKKKMIVFGVDIQHSMNIVSRYRNEGFVSEHLDCNTPRDLRRAVIRKFKNGDITILSNVGIVNEGFDLPDCDVVQLARPTKSLTLFMQQIGRCLRPHPNKEYAIILDNAGCWRENGLPTTDRIWTLKGVSKKDIQEDICAIDGNKCIHEVNNPIECKGLELKLIEEIVTMNRYEIEKSIERIEKQIKETEQGMINLPQEYHPIIQKGLTVLKVELQNYINQLEIIYDREIEQRIENAKKYLTEVLENFLNHYRFESEQEKKKFLSDIIIEFDSESYKVRIGKKKKKAIRIEDELEKIRKTRRPRIKIKGFQLLGIYHPVNKGVDLITNSLDKLIELYPDRIEEIFKQIYEERVNNYDRRYFAKKQIDLYSENVDADQVKNSAKQLDNGWWVDTHSATEQKIELLNMVIRKMGLKINIDFKIDCEKIKEQ